MMLKGRGGEYVYQFTWRAVAVLMRRDKAREVMVVECIALIDRFCAWSDNLGEFVLR